MRIALIAPPWRSVPAHDYGEIEGLVGSLADGLVQRGHDVTLFASGGSTSRARVVSTFAVPPPFAEHGELTYDIAQVFDVYRRACEFDVINNHSGIIAPALGALVHEAGGPPTLQTQHGFWDTMDRNFVSSLTSSVGIIAVGDEQARANTDVDYAGIVRHGLEIDRYPLAREKDEFLVFVGRGRASTGPDRAIAIAREAGLPLMMVVQHDEPEERRFWSSRVEPLLGPDIDVYEHLSSDLRRLIVARACALVSPGRAPEACPLAALEAMACGTPVVGSAIGGMAEVVETHVTGVLADTDEELAAAVPLARRLAAVACRDRVKRLFNAERMVDEYEAIFEWAVTRPATLTAAVR